MSPTAPRSLYVYYRIAPEHAASALSAFEHARAALKLPVALMQRPPAAGATSLTWMEVYPPDAATQEPAIAQALAPWIADGGRHLEWFEPVA